MPSEGAGQQAMETRVALRIALAGAVISVAIIATVVALYLILEHYPVPQPATTGGGTGNDVVASGAGDDRSTAVVAVLAPVIAGILAIVGLYFGVSSTNTRRAEAEARGEEAKQTAATSSELAATKNATAVAVAATGNMTPEQFRTLVDQR